MVTPRGDLFDKLDLFSHQNRVESTATIKNGGGLIEQGMNGLVPFRAFGQGAGYLSSDHNLV